jgi:hypothetical protein
MTRFNIIGRGFLDIEAGNVAGFTRSNPWFRFADVELGRSVEFSVPATAHNRIVLGFGDDPSEYGEQLRIRHACQLIYDGGQVMGTMTVTAYAGGAFSCVFLIGGASWIDRLQKMKLSECQSALSVLWVAGDGVPTTQVDYSQGVQLLRYDNGLPSVVPGWGVVPSVNVRYFLNEILTNLGVPHAVNVTQALYMVAGSMQNGQEEGVEFFQGDSTDLSKEDAYGYFDIVDINVEWATAILFGNYVGGGSNAIKAFKVTHDLKLTFDNVPADIFLIEWDMRLKNCECLGGYPSNMSGIDEYWRGRFKDLSDETVELKKGQTFFFADYFGFVQSTNLWASSQILSQGYFGWQDNAHGVSITAVAAANVDLQLGEWWYMRNNMPDMTVFEFLKSICLATGYELTVDPVDGLTIGYGKYGDPKGDDFKALERVLSVDRVARSAWGDNTAVALVGFDSDDYVTDTIEVEYGIPNEVNTERREWRSKFSEGNVGDHGVLIADVDPVDYKFTAKRWTLALAYSYLDTLQRIHSPVAVGYHDIAANSTAVTVKALLPLVDFFTMKPSTTWLWRGCAYLWSKASWSDGVLTMELQRVSAERVEMLPPQPPTVTSIEAVFTQPQQPIVGTDNLDDLKQYLTVTAIFSDSNTRVLDANEYTLSGTLAYPSATVTVDFQGVTATFTVVVAYDAQVEYLESTGTQYIDTGITGDQDTKVMVEVSYYVESSIATSGRVLGSRTNSPNRLDIGSNNGRSSESTHNFAQFGSNSSASSNIIFGMWRLMEVNPTGYYIDGVLQGSSFSASTFTTPQTMKLFAFDHNGIVGCGVVRVKSLKLFDGADLVRDFIPVRCGTIGYMYDRVSGTLFGNDGTGDFVVGPDV